MYSISLADGFGKTNGRVLICAGGRTVVGGVGSEGEEHSDPALPSENVRPLSGLESNHGFSATPTVLVTVTVLRRVCFSTGEGSCDTDRFLVDLVTLPEFGARKGSDFSAITQLRVLGIGGGGSGCIGEAPMIGADFSF